MYCSPVLDVIELCKTKCVDDISESVFILFSAMAGCYTINFIRKLDWIALAPNFVGILITFYYHKIRHTSKLSILYNI